jgi:hypothetical protein
MKCIRDSTRITRRTWRTYLDVPGKNSSDLYTQDDDGGVPPPLERDYLSQTLPDVVAVVARVVMVAAFIIIIDNRRLSSSLHLFVPFLCCRYII